jgi:hypothetical protein
MITPKLYETLDHEERKLWHSHVFEVKSGMLMMPRPSLVPESAWEIAETKEMEEVVLLYGKAIHTWQIDRGDALPLGLPQLMTSFSGPEHFKDFEEAVGDRDARLNGDWKRKKEARKHIEEPIIHPDADSAWKKT